MNTNPNRKPVVAVVGFPRSGTSLMMRMLHQGGMEYVADNEASYESELANPLKASGNEVGFLKECGGKAVKLLEPQRFNLPEVPFDFIWCRRQASEQGRSMAKFLRVVSGMPLTEEAHGPGFARNIVMQTRPVINSLVARPGCRVLEVWFERVLSYSTVEAYKVSKFLGLPLDVAKMAAQVRRRPSRCLAGMLELEGSERE